MNLNKRWHW